DRKSTRLNSSHVKTSYAVFCVKNKQQRITLRSEPMQRQQVGVGVQGEEVNRRPRRLQESQPVFRWVTVRQACRAARRSSTESAAQPCADRRCPVGWAEGTSGTREARPAWSALSLTQTPLPQGVRPTSFFTVAPPPAIYTLSLHDALPI